VLLEPGAAHAAKLKLGVRDAECCQVNAALFYHALLQRSQHCFVGQLLGGVALDGFAQRGVPDRRTIAALRGRRKCARAGEALQRGVGGCSVRRSG
jgi:hypothetical protein